MGRDDRIVQPPVSLASKVQLGAAVLEYIEIGGGHNSFMVNYDTSYFKINVLNHMKRLNPI